MTTKIGTAILGVISFNLTQQTIKTMADELKFQEPFAEQEVDKLTTMLFNDTIVKIKNFLKSDVAKRMSPHTEFISAGVLSVYRHTILDKIKMELDGH